MTIKNFRDGLFRVGDVVCITIRHKVRGHPDLEPFELNNVLIEEVGRDQLCLVQKVANPMAQPGEREHTLQYFWVHRSEIQHIHVMRSEAWRTEYGPANQLEPPRSRRSTPAMDYMREEREQEGRRFSWDDALEDRPF